jgi:CIC family chloride channel protein
MAGGAVGVVMNQVAPFPTGDPGAYALVGMGTLFAGIIRAPMTSVFMIFEITQDYQIIVPLMVANLLSFMISRRYQPIPIYHALLRQDGVHLPERGMPAEPTVWTARDMMTGDVAFVAGGSKVNEALERARATDQRQYLVGSLDELIGVVSRDQLTAAVESGHGGEPIAAIVDGPVVHAHPDDPIELVLDRFARSSGVLPIVNRGNVKQVEGVVTIREIKRAFEHRRSARTSGERVEG